MSIAAVILAAGVGSRFGGKGEKLLADAKGRPLLAWAIGPAYEAELDELVVVTGAADFGDLIPDDATVLRNDGWEQGLATSLGVAIDWCHRQGHLAAVVGLGDLPDVTTTAWGAVADARGGPIVAANFKGQRSHPIRLDAAVWQLLATSGDEGIPALMRTRPELVVDVDCEGLATDIDTRQDLSRWS